MFLMTSWASERPGNRSVTSLQTWEPGKDCKCLKIKKEKFKVHKNMRAVSHIQPHQSLHTCIYVYPIVSSTIRTDSVPVPFLPEVLL